MSHIATTPRRPRPHRLAATLALAPVAARAEEEAAEPGLLSDIPAGFTLTPNDAPYSFRTGVLSQSLATEQWSGPLSDTHAERLTQLRFRTIFELRSAPRPSGAFTRAFFQMEWIASPNLLDAELELRWSPAVGVMFGRYRSFFSRGWRTPLPALMAPGRGEALDAFRPERAFGATVFGELLDHKLEYAVSVQDMGAVDAKAPRVPLYIAHASFNPLGPTPYTQTPWFGEVSDLRVAVGGSAMLKQRGRVSTHTDERTLGAALTALHPSFAWISEAFDGDLRSTSSTPDAPARVEGRGLYTQVGVPLIARALDLQGRYGVIKARRLNGADLRLDARQVVEGSLGYYLAGNRAKLVLHYQRAEGVDPTALTPAALASLAAAPAAPPVEHRVEVFAQLMAW